MIIEKSEYWIYYDALKHYLNLVRYNNPQDKVTQNRIQSEIKRLESLLEIDKMELKL